MWDFVGLLGQGEEALGDGAPGKDTGEGTLGKKAQGGCWGSGYGAGYGVGYEPGQVEGKGEGKGDGANTLGDCNDKTLDAFK